MFGKIDHLDFEFFPYFDIRILNLSVRLFGSDLVR
jgi:hypothetical protein